MEGHGDGDWEGNEQGKRNWEEMDKEEETGKARQGAEIQDVQIKGWTDKETKIRVAQMQGQNLGMEKTMEPPFLLRAFNRYSLSTNYAQGTVWAAADPAGNKPHSVPGLLVSQSNERT